MTILVRYLQERLLYRVSQSEFKENFYLKGGALLYAFNQFSNRKTIYIENHPLFSDEFYSVLQEFVWVNNISPGKVPLISRISATYLRDKCHLSMMCGTPLPTQIPVEPFIQTLIVYPDGSPLRGAALELTPS